MSAKARRMAETAVDSALQHHGIAKAYGAAPSRDLLVSMALPAAEMVLKAQRVIKSNARGMTVMESQSALTDRALEQSRLALERSEAMAALMVNPVRFPKRDASQRFDDYVISSHPQTIPHVNGDSN